MTATDRPPGRSSYRRHVAPDAWRRVVRLILQGVEAPARGTLPEPPTPEQMYAAMQRGSSELRTGAAATGARPDDDHAGGLPVGH